MSHAFYMAWRQLIRERGRFLTAITGVAFAVTLIFMQLSFPSGLYESAVRFHSHLNGDLFLYSPQSTRITMTTSFPRRRLYQAMGYPFVEAVSAIYIAKPQWKNPESGRTRDIFVAGFDPKDRVFDLPEVNANLTKLRLPDRVLYDRVSRPEFGPIATLFMQGRPVSAEIAKRRVTVEGLFELGRSFETDGTVLTSDLNFLRLFRTRSPGWIDLGIIRLKPGADMQKAQRAIVSRVLEDVDVLTKQQFIDKEKTYWRSSTPIGYVFAFGVVMGLVVGTVIVYQILFADVSDHLAEYATLKAMGYRDAYLFAVVLSQGVILGVLGYFPGVVVTAGLQHMTIRATGIPMRMGLGTSVFVLGLAVAMCCVSGAIALRKIRTADPAEIF
jgi:putative ABC transport system permease protein